MKTVKSMLTVFIAAFALMASVAPSLALQPLVSGPYGEKAGNLYVTPKTFFEGQSVRITANFPSGHFWVTLHKETSPGSDQFEEIGFDETNRYGNAYFHDLDIDGSTRMYAQTETPTDVGWHTGIRTIAPEPVDPSGPTSGSLYVSPETFYLGQEISLTANFPSGEFTVTFFQETAPGSGDYQAVGTDGSNSYGNAYFTRYKVVDGARKVFAMTEDGRYSEVRTLDPNVVDPAGKPESGNLYVGPDTYFNGQEVSITANFPSGEFTVTFFQETTAGSGGYEVVGVDESNSYGNAYLRGHGVDGPTKIFALTDDGRYSQIRTLEPKAVEMPNASTGAIRFIPEVVRSGEPATVVAGFSSRCRDMRVNFFRDLGSTYRFIGSAVSHSSGDAYLRDVVFHEEYNRSIFLVAVTSQECLPDNGLERTNFESVDF